MGGAGGRDPWPGGSMAVEGDALSDGLSRADTSLGCRQPDNSELLRLDIFGSSS
jgi:hypothetical protein